LKAGTFPELSNFGVEKQLLDIWHYQFVFAACKR